MHIYIYYIYIIYVYILNKNIFLIITNISFVLHIILDCRRLWLCKSNEIFVFLFSIYSNTSCFWLIISVYMVKKHKIYLKIQIFLFYSETLF